MKYKVTHGFDRGYEMTDKLLLSDDEIIKLVGEAEFKILKDLEAEVLSK